MAQPVRCTADWERIEANYRAGVMTLREMAQADGNVTEGSIRKRAKRDEWTRDLKAKVQAKAEELVRKALVRAEVRNSDEMRTTEAQVVEVEAQVQARITMAHRADVTRGRKLSMTLLAELEAQTGDVGALATLGDVMRNPDENGVDKLNELYHKVIGLPSRTKTMKDMAETLRILIDKERQVFGIEGAGEAVASAFENLLDLAQR